ncbi:hypothetical protein HanXRQr2_Chr11g0483091 [Helianthus annuus]|uniref:Uncharacterized protein n=1 Tax=Helianthus annuus TaxID=4232 RepID=A0A9K3HN11_HELAN|nr:hypothetical protein HanXRQr2_Chr11g0483091 [Helianthus annuus]KAJ0874541.1 hypothetical protein HanPSC8_Chr11g0465381 [Helianthus annuus]
MLIVPDYIKRYEQAWTVEQNQVTPSSGFRLYEEGWPVRVQWAFPD